MLSFNFLVNFPIKQEIKTKIDVNFLKILNVKLLFEIIKFVKESNPLIE